MSSKRRVILTCAVTGGNSFNRKFPNYPISPQQIAAAAFEAQEAGASAVHLHVRDPQAGDGSREPSMSKVRMEIEGRSMRRGPKLEPIVLSTEEHERLIEWTRSPRSSAVGSPRATHNFFGPR
jgi:beta-keto acid cleavage enzyme